jgi:hypothetical protein
MTGAQKNVAWVAFQTMVLLLFALMLNAQTTGVARKPQSYELPAKDTLTVLRLYHGDAFRFRLKNGQVRSFLLEVTSAWIVERLPSGIVYAFECRLRADGQPLTLRRYAVCLGRPSVPACLPAWLQEALPDERRPGRLRGDGALHA